MTPKLAAAAAALLACSCTIMIPRTTVLGQTAAPMTRGTTELALSAGAVYTHEGSQSTGCTTNCSTMTYVQIPTFDGSLSTGLSETVDFNIHGGNTGLQPGLKLNLLRGDVAVAFEPQLGLGYVHAKKVSSSGSTSNSSEDDVLFAPGARLLISGSSGTYFGASYTFGYLHGSSDNETSTYSEHELLFGLGHEFVAGALRVRPEVDFLLVPKRSWGDDYSSGGYSQSTSGDYDGKSYSIGLSVTFALRTGEI
jgi:hypothetical protein